VRLVVPQTGRELAVLEPPPELFRGVGRIGLSPDGARLAVTNERDVLVWDLRQIRSQLRTMGLDWGAPPIPAPAGGPPVRVKVEGADGLAEASEGYARLLAGDLDGAAAPFARATGRGANDPKVWYFHLLFRLRAGDRAAYRAGCAAMASKFGREGRPGSVRFLARACVIAPEVPVDWAAMLDAVEGAMSRQSQPGEACELSMLRGALLVRAGRTREAIAALGESARHQGLGGNAYDWLFLALARHRSGQAGDASDALARAGDWIAHADERARDDPYVISPLPWYSRLELDQLRREAEGLIARPPDECSKPN
jgi:hypothetical protein